VHFFDQAQGASSSPCAAEEEGCGCALPQANQGEEAACILAGIAATALPAEHQGSLEEMRARFLGGASILGISRGAAFASSEEGEEGGEDADGVVGEP
jgi:hypothetical protein